MASRPICGAVDPAALHRKHQPMSLKQNLQRYFSDRDAILNSRMGGWLGERIHDPEIWHFGRRAVAGAVGIGFFVGFMPVPMHMLIAAMLALMLRINLPVALAAVWINNPITVAPMVMSALKLGGWVTAHEVQFSDIHFNANWANISALFTQLWEPLVVGCLLCGLGAGALGNFSVRGLWRLHVLYRCRQRRLRRRARTTPSP